MIKIISVFATLLVLTFIAGSNAQCGLPGYGLSAVRFRGTTPGPYPYVLLDSSVSANSTYDTLLNFTIQAWVYLTPGATNIRTIVVKAPRTSNGDDTYNNGLQFKQEFSLEVTGTNNLRFRMGCDLTYGFDIQTMGVLPTGTWVNVAVTMNYDTATAQLYVNGQLQTLSSGGLYGNWSSSCAGLKSGLTGPYRTSYYPGGPNVPRVIGGTIQVGLYSILYATAPNFYLGLVDELSIWSTVLTEGQIAANTASGLRGDETGLVSYHSFNEGSGTADYSPFPSTGPFRFVPTSTPVIPGYLYNNVQWASSSLQLDYPRIGLPYTPNQATKLPLYGIESNGTQNVLYYNITSLPLNGYLTGYPSSNPRGSLSTPSTTEVTLRLYDILQNTSGDFPVVSYHSNRNYFGSDSFTYNTFSLENGAYVSCSGTVGANSGARVYLSTRCTFLDRCGVCNGDGSTCNSTLPIFNGTCCVDACGVPGGDGSSCAGCDGVPRSGLEYDECGVCGGNNTECADCNGIPNGPNPPNQCGCCYNGTGYECPDAEVNPDYCLDCNGCPFGTAVEDACGVCGGDNSTCIGCDGTVNGPSADLCGDCSNSIFNYDQNCGVAACDNLPNVFPDECGVCGGDNSTCQCVFYKNYQIAKMDCVLIEFTLNHTLCIIDELVAELELSLTYFENNTLPIDYHLVQNEILALNQFIDGGVSGEACLENFCGQLSSAISTVSKLVY